MGSFLVCKRGGVITPVTDGQVMDFMGKFGIDWKGEHITPEFLQKVAEICEKLGIAPDDLMCIMAAESKLNPQAENLDKHRNLVAIGLIQFANYDNFGYSREKIREMDAIQQLDLVEKFFQENLKDRSSANPKNVIDLYTLNFLPGAGGYGQGNDYIIAEKDGRYSWAYDGNDGLDKDKDGRITRGDLEEHLNKKVNEYLLENQ
jgi:hypothetical protein